MKELENISSYNFAEIKGYAYFSNLFYNALFKVEIKTGKTFFLGRFEGEKLFETNIHLEIMQEEDRIYFFPRRGHHLHIYHISNETMHMIEIRKKLEEFYVIGEIILEDDFIYFLPKQKNNPIKKLNRNTYEVTIISDKLNIQGKYLSKSRKIFPAAMTEKYQIKYGNQISCKQMPDEKWYSFMPVGRQLLYYTEGIDSLEKIPLTVVNGVELQKHLHKVKLEFFEDRLLFEVGNFKLLDFFDAAMLSNELKRNRYEGKSKYSVGEAIWKVINGSIG